jgi:hypothetical protein
MCLLQTAGEQFAQQQVMYRIVPSGEVDSMLPDVSW